MIIDLILSIVGLKLQYNFRCIVFFYSLILDNKGKIDPIMFLYQHIFSSLQLFVLALSICCCSLPASVISWIFNHLCFVVTNKTFMRFKVLVAYLYFQFVLCLKVIISILQNRIKQEDVIYASLRQRRHFIFPRHVKNIFLPILQQCAKTSPHIKMPSIVMSDQ